jgi:hypothetical protein
MAPGPLGVVPCGTADRTAGYGSTINPAPERAPPVTTPDSSKEGREPELASPILSLDTTHGSFLHGFKPLAGVKSGQAPSVARIYLLSVAATYIALAITALISAIPLGTPSNSLKLPFLHDWNIALMFLLSFPCVMILTLTDQHALTSALNRVISDGTVALGGEAAIRLRGKWEKRFRIVNIAGQSLGVIIGLSLTYFNHISYSPQSTGYWIASNGVLEPVGYVFLYCIFLFYAIIPVYIIRLIFTSLFLGDLVKCSTLRLLPFHPDKSGGLRPVGRLGLRNQYGLTIFGLNVVSLVVVSILYLEIPSSLYGLIVAAGLAYLILGPLVFMGPLLPFRAGMRRTKNDLMGEVAQRLRVELQGLRAKLPKGEITKADEELIERLRKIGRVIDELPVWPFDASTLRRFVTAYVLPIMSAVAYPAVTKAGETLANWFAS